MSREMANRAGHAIPVGADRGGDRMSDKDGRTRAYQPIAAGWISPNVDRSDLVLVTVGKDDAVVVVEKCKPDDWRLGYRTIDQWYRTTGSGYRIPPVVVVETERLLSEVEVEESLSKAWDIFRQYDE